MTSSTVKSTLPWIVAVALFMEQLDTTIVNTAVPAMADSLGVTPLSLKAVVTSYILSLAVGIPVSGLLLTDPPAVTHALRYAFLIMGAMTMLSSLSFWSLRPRDGESVSRGHAEPTPQ